MKVLIFFLKILNRQYKSLIESYQFFAKFGFVPPRNVIISNVQKIEIGKDFRISQNCQLICQHPDSSLKIGDNVSVNYDVMINSDGGGSIIIGNDVLIGPKTVIRAANHGASDLGVNINKQPHVPGKIVIENNVWIGANVVILPDVHVHSGAVIAAGAVVNKNVGENEIVGGVPAKLIKKRD